MNPFQKIQTPALAISKARANMLVNQPFFGVLAMRLQARAAPDVTETTATEGRYMYYNPEYIQSLTMRQLSGLMCHLVMHLALKHHERRNNRDYRLWQQACDYAINPILADAKVELLPDALYAPVYRGMAAEQVYAQLLNQQGKDDQPGGAPAGGGVGDQGGAGAQGEQRPEQGPPGGQGQGQASQGGAPGPIDPSTAGEVLDLPSKAPVAAQGDSWDSAMAQALRSAAKAGKLPGNLHQFIQELVDPVLPWEAILRKFLTEVSQDDFDWTYPNRQYMSLGLYLPCAHSERMRRLAVAIDTSSSIDTKALKLFLSEVNGIAEEVDFEQITVLQCDRKIHKIDEFEDNAKIELGEIKGRGGTAFEPVFEWLETEGDIDCLVYFTDLEVRSIPEDPCIPVLWAKQPANGRRIWTTPTYGEIVEIE